MIYSLGEGIIAICRSAPHRYFLKIMQEPCLKSSTHIAGSVCVPFRVDPAYTWNMLNCRPHDPCGENIIVGRVTHTAEERMTKQYRRVRSRDLQVRPGLQRQ